MPPAKKEENCTEHSIDIALLKSDVSNLKQHSETVLETIENGFKELNLKVRQLEDRKLIGQFLEKILWLAAGAFITVLIHQNYIAVTNKQDYKIEKQSKKNR